MDKVCHEAKENIKKGLEKLNSQPITDENADIYKDLTEALYHLELIEAMKKGSEYDYSGDYPVHMSRDGIDGDNDGRYNESRGRNMPRWYYSGHNGKDRMIQDAEAMMADADTDKERRRIRDFIEDIKAMKER